MFQQKKATSAVEDLKNDLEIVRADANAALRTTEQTQADLSQLPMKVNRLEAKISQQNKEIGNMAVQLSTLQRQMQQLSAQLQDAMELLDE